MSGALAFPDGVALELKDVDSDPGEAAAPLDPEGRRFFGDKAL